MPNPALYKAKYSSISKSISTQPRAYLSFPYTCPSRLYTQTHTRDGSSLSPPCVFILKERACERMGNENVRRARNRFPCRYVYISLCARARDASSSARAGTTIYMYTRSTGLRFNNALFLLPPARALIKSSFGPFYHARLSPALFTSSRERIYLYISVSAHGSSSFLSLFRESTFMRTLSCFCLPGAVDFAPEMAARGHAYTYTCIRARPAVYAYIAKLLAPFASR